MQNFCVIKSDGGRETFSQKKVFDSALRAGAPKALALEIAQTVKKEVYPGMKTSEIFREVGRLLKKDSRQSAIRFNLKRAIKELGPTGFPFEKYVGEIFKSLGYAVKLNQIIPGRCNFDYEIDFLAQKEGVIYVGECKYRNFFSDIVDLKDSLANYARFSDVKDGGYFSECESGETELKSLLVTNGKFTQKAVNYSGCKGVEALGWRQPKEQGLEYIVENNKLYPVTILSSLKGYMKNSLVENNIMLAKDLLNIDTVSFSRKTKIQERDLFSLIKEVRVLVEEL
jgi:hypothetical protein